MSASTSRCSMAFRTRHFSVYEAAEALSNKAGIPLVMKGDPWFSHHISLRTLGVKVMGL